jgi:hypothetical protein
VYRDMASVDESITVRAYYDDAYILAGRDTPRAHLEAAVSRWMEGTKKLGGRPNPKKCTVYCSSDDCMRDAILLAAQFGFALVGPEGGVEVCGVPLGSEGYVASRLQGQLDRHERIFRQLKKMDPQCANLLLRFCVHPRMGHLMRTVPHRELSSCLSQFDHRVEDALRSFAELPACVDALFIRASFRRGGLGLRTVENVCPAANLASLSLCLPALMEASPRLERYVSKLQEGKAPGVPPEGKGFDDLCWQAENASASVLVVLFEAWAQLWQSGLRNSVPVHPFELVRGYYEETAKGEPYVNGFKIQKFITQELDEGVGNRLQALCDRLGPAVAARYLINLAALLLGFVWFLISPHFGFLPWSSDKPCLFSALVRLQLCLVMLFVSRRRIAERSQPLLIYLMLFLAKGLRQGSVGMMQ